MAGERGVPLAKRPFPPVQTPGSGTASWTRMTEGTVAFPAPWRSGLASPAHPAVAPWDGPGATPVNRAQWPTPVSPAVGGHRRARPRTHGVVFATGGTLRTREGEGLPWVTEHILGSSSAVPLSRSLSAVPSGKFSVCFYSLASSVRQQTPRAPLCAAQGAGDPEKDEPQPYTLPHTHKPVVPGLCK